MNWYKIALSADEEKILRDYAFSKPIDEFKAGDYIFTLTQLNHELLPTYLKNIKPTFPTYQIGLNKEGMSFCNINQVMQKNPTQVTNIKQTLKEVKEGLKKWTQQYGELGVNSNNRRKLQCFENILANMGFLLSMRNVGQYQYLMIN